MISNSMAKSIMGWIFGIDPVTYIRTSNNDTKQIATSLLSPATLYIGMCADEPDKTNGNIKEGSEPFDTAGNGKFGYKRQPIGGSGKIPTITTNGGTLSAVSEGMTRVFQHVDGANGVIENSEEIQFNTATGNYDKTMKYWFLSTSSGGSAFIWGQIKDILWPQSTNNIITQEITCNKTESSDAYPKGNSLYGLNSRAYYEAEALSDPFTMSAKDDNKYIVTWDNQDYTVTPRIYKETDEKGKVIKQYMHLGNAEADGQSGSSNDASPFFIRYTIERGDDEAFNDNEINIQSTNRGLLKVYSFDTNDYLEGKKPEERKHTFGLYGEGINIPVATVPTFYPTQLRASLDVAL